MTARLVLVAGTLLTLAMILPQIGRVARRRTAQGVSPTWPVLGTTINGAWTGYLVISADLPLAAVTTFTMTVTYAVLSALVLRLHPERRRDSIARGVASLVAIGAIGGAWGWELLGTALGLSYGLQLMPAVVSVYRSTRLEGVSRLTWWTALVEAGCWGFYGYSTGDSAVIIYGLTGIAFTAAICVRLAWVDRLAQAGGTSLSADRRTPTCRPDDGTSVSNDAWMSSTSADQPPRIPPTSRAPLG